MDLLAEMIEGGNCLILFSTHITSDLDRIADYITIIADGRIKLSLTKEMLENDYDIVKTHAGKQQFAESCSILDMRKNNVCIEALVSNGKSARKYISEDFIVEKPSIKVLMYYFK